MSFERNLQSVLIAVLMAIATSAPIIVEAENEIFTIGNLEFNATVVNSEALLFERVHVWISLRNKGEISEFIPFVSCNDGLNDRQSSGVRGTVNAHGKGELQPGEYMYGLVSCTADRVGSRDVSLLVKTVPSTDPINSLKKMVEETINIGRIEVNDAYLASDLRLINTFEEEERIDGEKKERNSGEGDVSSVHRPPEPRSDRFWEFCSRRFYPQRPSVEGPLGHDAADAAEMSLKQSGDLDSTYFLNDRVGYLLHVADFINQVNCKGLNRIAMYPPYMSPGEFDRALYRQRRTLSFLSEAGDRAKTAAAVWAAKGFFWEILADEQPDPEELFRSLRSLGIELDEMTKQSISARAAEFNADQPESPVCRKGRL